MFADNFDDEKAAKKDEEKKMEEELVPATEQCDQMLK